VTRRKKLRFAGLGLDASRQSGLLGGFRHFGWFVGPGQRRRGSKAFFETDNKGVRDFPAEGFHLTALYQALFQENRAAGVGGQGAHSRKDDVASPVLNFDPVSDQGVIASHSW
jgi:hypothetical protein